MSRTPAPRPDDRSILHPVRIFSVPQFPEVHVKFLGCLRGLLTHWTGKKSVPCHNPEPCPTQFHKYGVIFKAYAPVEVWQPADHRWRPFVLEATAVLEQYLAGRKLRGEVWLLSREDPTRKGSPVHAAYCEAIPDELVSPEFDITPVLYRAYAVTTLNLGVPNPMPRRLHLVDREGPPPFTPKDLQPPPPPEEDPEERRKVAESIAEARKMFRRGGAGQRSAGAANGQSGPPPSPAEGNGFAH